MCICVLNCVCICPSLDLCEKGICYPGVLHAHTHAEVEATFHPSHQHVKKMRWLEEREVQGGMMVASTCDGLETRAQRCILEVGVGQKHGRPLCFTYAYVQCVAG